MSGREVKLPRFTRPMSLSVCSYVSRAVGPANVRMSIGVCRAAAAVVNTYV